MLQSTLQDFVIKSIDNSQTLEYKSDAKHIFYSILDYASASLNVEDKMAMYFHYNCCNNLLTHARLRKTDLVAFWSDYINLNTTTLPQKAEHGMDAIYFPAIGYCHYAAGKYAEALDAMDKSILAIDNLIQDGLDIAKFAKVEQTLNRFKIILKIDIENAIEEAFKLITFAYSNSITTNFQFPYESISDNGLKKENQRHFIVNSIIFSILKTQRKLAKLALQKLFNKIKTNTSSQKQNDSVDLIILLSNYFNDNTISISLFQDDKFFNLEIPFSLKLLIQVQLLNKLRDQHDVDFNSLRIRFMDFVHSEMKDAQLQEAMEFLLNYE